MILTAVARTDVGQRRTVHEHCFALAAKLGGGHGVPTLGEIPAEERHQWTRGRED